MKEWHHIFNVLELGMNQKTSYSVDSPCVEILKFFVLNLSSKVFTLYDQRSLFNEWFFTY